MSEPVASILGFGCKVPDAIRGNDDPIFAYLNELRKYVEGSEFAQVERTPAEEFELMASWGFLGGNRSPFYGYETRHVLAQEESLVDLMKPAAEEALRTANVSADQIDILLGCASVGRYIVPSDLYELHQKLKLPPSTLAVPLGNDFSNFNVALVFADSLIRAGRASNVLIAIGGSWSRAVDYRTLQAYSAGDGAAAVVVSARPPLEEWQTWRVVDEEVLAASKNFGTMYLSEVLHTEQTNRLHRYAPNAIPPKKQWQWPGMPIGELETAPCFHITPSGFQQFGSFGAMEAYKPAEKLKKKIEPADVTLIAHQASDALSDVWEGRIKPAYFFKTTKHYANMTVANIPVNLTLALSPTKDKERAAMDLREATTPYVLLLALGPDMHAHALLLEKMGVPS